MPGELGSCPDLGLSLGPCPGLGLSLGPRPGLGLGLVLVHCLDLGLALGLGGGGGPGLGVDGDTNHLLTRHNFAPLALARPFLAADGQSFPNLDQSLTIWPPPLLPDSSTLTTEVSFKNLPLPSFSSSNVTCFS